MNKVVFLLAALLQIGIMQAQELKTIKLNAPNKDRGSSVMKALSDRHSDTQFSTQKLSLQDLSDLLWAANGINRPDGKRTAPSAMNAQDISVYALMEEGAFLYNPKTNSLDPVKAGDLRGIVGGREEMKTAPIVLLLVTDLSLFERIPNKNDVQLMVAMDAGIVSQNINIFCAATGLSTRPRAGMDRDAIKKALNLSENQLPLLNNPVGYPKK